MSNLPLWLETRLKEAPNRPGCYLMVGDDDAIVYVGKAKNLKKRLQQYFRPNTNDSRFFVSLLEDLLTRIDVIISNNDKEAYILEAALIKKHKPRFNIRLKDDKSFLHILLNRKVPWPRLEVIRRPTVESSDLFGPYASATSIRQSLEVINRHFQLRTCSDTEFKSRVRPCLEHQIGRCPAPCVKKVNHDDYMLNVAEVRLFLSGNGKKIIDKLKMLMDKASEDLQFEKAAHLRDRMEAIQRSLTPQSIAFSSMRSVDALGLYREGAQGSLDVLRVREGILADVQSFPQDDQKLPSSELVSNFIRAYYESHAIPDLILTPVELDDPTGLGDFLSSQKGKKTMLRCPQKGDKRRLMDLASTNAQETTRATFGQEKKQEAVLEGLVHLLKLQELPRRIECYDISNIQGTEPVASMVVALDGVLAKQEYRTYRIRSGDTPDDYRMMAEVLDRRLNRGLKEGNLPNLIVLDGGRGQLNVATRTLDRLGIESIELASLAKERLEDEEGRIARKTSSRPSSRTTTHRPDRVFRPGRKNPLRMAANSNELFLLQRLRDEAHRFAVTYHKKLRRRRTLTSQLLTIEGVGPKRMTALLKHFGSLTKLKRASAEDIASCPGFGLEVAQRIVSELKP
jgi:excinuclease ABC subunit C